MRSFLIAVVSLSFAGAVFGQVRVGRTSINCVGSSTVSNGLLISQSGGQPSNVSVSNSGRFMIRQGFQQANLEFSVEEAEFSVSLFPNPNDGAFNVLLNGFGEQETVDYVIFDQQGKQVAEGYAAQGPEFAVNIPTLENGTYFMKFNSSASKKAMVRFVVIK
jgi:hypothetical protein